MSIVEIDYEYTMQLYFKYETELEKNKLEKGIYEREKKSIEEAINNHKNYLQHRIKIIAV